MNPAGLDLPGDRGKQQVLRLIRGVPRLSCKRTRVERAATVNFGAHAEEERLHHERQASEVSRQRDRPQGSDLGEYTLAVGLPTRGRFSRVAAIGPLNGSSSE